MTGPVSKYQCSVAAPILYSFSQCITNSSNNRSFHFQIDQHGGETNWISTKENSTCIYHALR